MSATQTVGFVTMTFDSCHQGHFDLLRGCSKRCDYLIVGLTTDAQVRKEKRDPILVYEQRFAILNSCKFVDEVVPNNGEPKQEMYQKLKFDVLFTGDDYFDSAEFTSFSNEYPEVPVFYLPRHVTRSSSMFISALMDRFYQSQQIVAPSIYGYIVRQGYGKPFHVTKCLPFSRREVRSPYASEDVFGFYSHYTLPRNWKEPNQSHAPKFPMISGIHTNRELLMNQELKSQPWCTYVSHNVVYDVSETEETSSEQKHANQNQQSLLDFANSVCHERSMPCKVIQLVQRDAGITFEEWCRSTCASQEEFQAVIDYVKDVIIAFLERNRIVHSDIHPRNVLIDTATKQISLIDFGWVTSLTFALCAQERAALTAMIANQFDWTHFQKSLALCPSTSKWLASKSATQVIVHVE